MTHSGYLMESDEEAIRLDVKTDARVVEDHGRWAGIRPGMRVADLGCGSGKTTFHLHRLAQPGGSSLGVDIAAQRIYFARRHYQAQGLAYIVKDFCAPLGEIGPFDFIWMRFVLEYYRAQSADIVRHVAASLKPGGILCLLDLDCNCLRFHGFPPRLERAVRGIMEALEKSRNFDPYVGVKLYSILYDLGLEDIRVRVDPHNLIYGAFKESEKFNWVKKAQMAGTLSGFGFEEYPGGAAEFMEEIRLSFTDPRAFTYTPVIVCCGRKPQPGASPAVLTRGSSGG
jgi:SAM-dependent methyltransferase